MMIAFLALHNDAAMYIYLVLILIYFATSVIGVVTGSNSLIAVPAMFQLGIDARTAVATNMFALVFMAIGGAIPFLRKGQIERSSLVPLSAVTIIASAVGAGVASISDATSIKVVVTVAMIAVALFSLVYDHRRSPAADDVTQSSLTTLLTIAGVLGIYGGYFSGGYVTLLTAAFVGFGGMNYHHAIGTTKVVNIFSSLSASVVFALNGLIDYKLGMILGITMFTGAYLGGIVATKIDETLLKRIFLAAVILLAIKSIGDLATQFV